ncbi:hypothetical protein TSUD_307590 [Trifolium subterraneum]|nr:hypothetical protein TSUD_307590 [Trifolium subterraneum]
MDSANKNTLMMTVYLEDIMVYVDLKIVVHALIASFLSGSRTSFGGDPYLEKSVYEEVPNFMKNPHIIFLL